MKKAGPQTIKFSSGNNSSIACHNADESSAGNGNFNPNSQSNSYGVYSSNLVVKVQSTTHTSGSSAIATRNITNYPWDLIYIPGNLVAVHSSGNFIAYAIKAPRPPNGMVRIMCRSTGVRGLIKSIPGLIKDLAFACLSSRILLAFTNQYGTLYVYEVHEPTSDEEEGLRTELLVEIKRSDGEEASDYQRVIWCPFIPEEPGEDEQEEVEEENFAYLLVVTNGPLAEIWHIMSLIQEYGSGCIEHTQVKPGPGHHVVEQHSAPISDAAFSPDGTALATAALDGCVKFFQVYMTDDQSSPRCLHQWNPHDGKPLSCLFFLDNHKNPSPDVQFWKYAVTGCCNNSEIRVWSCETWQCNQTISFECSDELGIESPSLSLKAAIDPSSKYLVLSDIHRRVLYVLILYQETTSSSAATTIVSNGDSIENSPQAHGANKVGMARIISLSELPIQYPAMFLAITDAEWKPYKRWKHEHLGLDAIHDHQDYGDEDSDSMDIVEGLVIKCVLINTKSLQEATIQFQPVVSLNSNFDEVCNSSTAAASGCLNLSSSQDSIILKDGLTDLSLNISSSLSEIDNSSHTLASLRRQSEDDAGRQDKNVGLVSFPSKTIPVSMNILASNSSIVSSSSPHSSSATSGIVSSVIGTLSTVTMNESVTPISLEASIPPLPSPTLTPHGGLSGNIDVSPSGQPVTLNLLTPESFSSPGRVDDDDLNKKEDFVRVTECTIDKLTKRTPSPSEDLKSAALSLLLCVNSGSRHHLPEGNLSIKNLKSQNSNDRSILESAISGSSRSPPVNVLPPPPRTGPSPLPSKEDAPLATSEVSPATSSVSSGSSSQTKNILSSANVSSVGGSSLPNVGSGIGLASSTSSPSLEVQQILHAHNSKNLDDFADEDEDEIESELELAMGNNMIQYKKKSLSDASQCLLDLPQPPPSSLLPSQTSLQTSSPQSIISPNMLSNAPQYTMVSKSLPIQPPSSLSPHSVAETSLSSPQALQNLINITAASNAAKYESKKGSASQSPLIDMFAGLKSLHPTAVNQLTCSLLEAGTMKHSSQLVNSSTASSITSDGLPKYSLSYIGQKESQPSLSILNAIPAVKNHLTCEQLEADIKCASPTNKKSLMQNDLSASSPPGTFSSLNFPLNLTPLSSSYMTTSAPLNVENESGTTKTADMDDANYQKTQGEIASLRQLLLTCDSEQEERMKALLDYTRTLSNQIDKSIKNMHQITKIVEDLRKSQNKMQEQIPSLVSSSARPIIENTIRQEIRNSLTPAVNKCLDPIRLQLSSEVRSLVSNSEMHLSESLSKAVYSRTFIDNLSSSVSSALASSVQTACRDAYNKVVVPGFNAITQQVFVQLNEAFTRGTKEYMQHVESESQSTRTALIENMSKSSRSLETSASSLATHSTTLIETLHKNLAQQTSFSDVIGERLRHLIHDEIARALQEHHAAVEARTSRAQTPAPSGHTPTNPKIAQQQVQQLISQGQFNHAFKQALSASDLSLVVFVCERINPQQLFSQTPCPLSQDVLLSLVNQLSHDLNTFTDLKTKYLEESVVNLDTNHPVTREHMRKVLQGFQRSLTSHLALNPNHKKLKMLLLAVNHLVAA